MVKALINENDSADLILQISMQEASLAPNRERKISSDKFYVAYFPGLQTVSLDLLDISIFNEENRLKSSNKEFEFCTSGFTKRKAQSKDWAFLLWCVGHGNRL